LWKYESDDNCAGSQVYRNDKIRQAFYANCPRRRGAPTQIKQRRPPTGPSA
jgi:hypothetical protein